METRNLQRQRTPALRSGHSQQSDATASAQAHGEKNSTTFPAFAAGDEAKHTSTNGDESGEQVKVAGCSSATTLTKGVKATTINITVQIPDEKVPKADPYVRKPSTVQGNGTKPLTPPNGELSRSQMVPDEVVRICLREVSRCQAYGGYWVQLQGQNEKNECCWNQFVFICSDGYYLFAQKFVHEMLRRIPVTRDTPVKLAVPECLVKPLTAYLPRWADNGWKRLDGGDLKGVNLWQSIHWRLSVQTPMIAIESMMEFAKEEAALWCLKRAARSTGETRIEAIARACNAVQTLAHLARKRS